MPIEVADKKSIQCPNCGNRLTKDDFDMNREDIGSNNNKEVKCPECGNKNIVDNEINLLGK